MEMKGKALDGKVAVVTGGASGIGEAVGKIFVENSCKVFLVDNNGERLKKVVAEITKEGGNCKGIYADVSVESQVRNLFQDVMEEYGRVDVLVNSAGRDSLSPPITEVTLEEWEKTIDPNLKAVLHAHQPAARYQAPEVRRASALRDRPRSTRPRPISMAGPA